MISSCFSVRTRTGAYFCMLQVRVEFIKIYPYYHLYIVKRAYVQ